MKRKIIQIFTDTAGSISDDSSIMTEHFALCNDGTIWQWAWKTGKWIPSHFDTIPQDKPKETDKK